MKSFKQIFDSFCKKNNIKKNSEQLDLVEKFDDFHAIISEEASLIGKIFSKKPAQLGYYIYGDVGVGKTMICNEFFNYIDIKKKKTHFNKFMIEVHDFIQNNQKNDKAENLLIQYARSLKEKINLLYFDEFQVTNIVDAMILGKLFKKIFEEKIKVIFSSNIKIDDLYKDGLQRDQFIPFIKILKNNCFEKELFINEDYRSSRNKNLERYLSPINNSANFMFNKYLRVITKDKKKTTKVLEVKGRKILLENFFEGVVRFNFDELCNRNLGSEDYIEIANASDFIFLENLPDFNENNSNQQQRFISLIDIIYEKKIPMMITSEIELNLIKSSKNLIEPFKRTISRLYELTSINYN